MKINKKIWIFGSLLMLNSLFTIAQTFDNTTPAEEGDRNFTPVGPEPPPQADINQYLIFGLMIAIGLAFVYFYKMNRKLQNTSDINL